MTETDRIFEGSATFDPAGDFDAFLKLLPAKWVVYLLCDVDDRPVQLLCVKNLRASLKRRLGLEEADAGPSKRVNYRELVRHVHFRRVDSAFEADWLYFEAARRLFPLTYQGMVGFRPAWFVHVNPETHFPRFVKTIDLTGRTGVYLGPVEDKHAAARLIELVEDGFDLCRYYNILVDSPDGKACAYKEMGKCPAPCDGSISMDGYRRMVQWATNTIVDPGSMLRQQESRMRAAAGELRFEIAAKIKAHIELLGQLGKGPFRHVRRLDDFRYVALQHGPRIGTAKLFLITPGGIEQAVSLIDEQKQTADLSRYVLLRGNAIVSSPLAKDQIERIGIVAHHLFTSKATHGVFLPLAELEDRSLVRAYRELMKQKRPEETEGEGILKELQSMDNPSI